MLNLNFGSKDTLAVDKFSELFDDLSHTSSVQEHLVVAESLIRKNIMVKMRFNLKNTLVLEKIPQLYADLMDTTEVQQYFYLAETFKADIIRFTEEEFKKIKKINSVIQDCESLLVDIEKQMNGKINLVSSVTKKKQPSLKDIQQKLIKKLNKNLWKNFFKSINIEYKLFSEIKAVVSNNNAFNEQLVLECLKIIDGSISIESTSYIYEQMKPILNYKISNNGDVTISLKDHPSIIGITPQYGLALNHKNFYWLMRFIAFNNKNPKFNANRLTIKHKEYMNNPDYFSECGFKVHNGDYSKELVISKHHLFFLKNSIGFVAKKN